MSSVVNITLIVFFAMVFIAILTAAITGVITIARYCRPVDDEED